MSVQDNSFDSSISFLKDASHDPFRDQASDSGGGSQPHEDLVNAALADAMGDLTLGITPSANAGGGGGGGNGEEPKRFAVIGLVDETGARSIERDKEQNFRPKVAKFVHDSVTYRHFTDGAEGGGGATGGDITQTVQDSMSDALSSVAVGASGNANSSAQSASGPGGWASVDPNDVGIELSLISDLEGTQKSRPDWNPFHPNSPSRSTLIVSRQELEDADKDPSLPSRYYGRLSDALLAISTQGNQRNGAEGIHLQRVKFPGGFFSKNKTNEDYEEGVVKGVWNITPEDKPIEGGLDQKNEYEDGPGKHGWRAFDYPEHGFPIPVGGERHNPPATYPQGGWLYDAKQDALGMLHDILMIDAEDSDAYALPRYRTRFGSKVGVTVMRHDAQFARQADDACPPDGKREVGRIYFTEPTQCPIAAVATESVQMIQFAGPGQPSEALQIEGPPDPGGEATQVCGDMVFDPALANRDTALGHECGEWRPRVFVKTGGGGHDKYYYCNHSRPSITGDPTFPKDGGDPTPTGSGTSTTTPQDTWVAT